MLYNLLDYQNLMLYLREKFLKPSIANAVIRETSSSTNLLLKKKSKQVFYTCK